MLKILQTFTFYNPTIFFCKIINLSSVQWMNERCIANWNVWLAAVLTIIHLALLSHYGVLTIIDNALLSQSGVLTSLANALLSQYRVLTSLANTLQSQCWVTEEIVPKLKLKHILFKILAKYVKWKSRLNIWKILLIGSN